MIDPPPRSFQDATMPPPEVAHEDDFEAYTAWLAEYLYATEIPIATRQQILIEQNANGVSSCGILPLAMNIGWALDDLNMICDAVNDGQTYEQFIAAQLKLWHECDDADPQYLDNWTISPDIFTRIAEKEAERRATGLEFPMLDMPWRGVISQAMKQIKDPAERLHAIKSFVYEIWEAQRE